MKNRNWGSIRDFAILVVLLVISLVVLLSQESEAYRAARGLALEVTGPINGVYARVGQFSRALEENASLRAETVQLSAEVSRLRAARRENERLRALVGFRDTIDAEMLPARVVSKDIARQDNRLTINVGTADGVSDGMPVLDERGLIGKVVLAGRNYSLVMPHQNTNFAVPAQITELGRDGIVRWDGQQFDRLVMEHVVKTEPVEPGMLISTSLVSRNYPPGVPIGRVDSVFAARGRNDLVIYLRPSASLSSVDVVYVVLNPLDDEFIAVESAQVGPARR